MSKNDCNPCDINTDDVFTVNSRLVNQNKIYVKPNGEYSLDQVDVLLEDFKAHIQHEPVFNSLDRIIQRFGNEAIQESTKEIQDFANTNDLTEYPELADRIALGPITNLEICEFFESQIYTPSKITNSIQNDPGKFLRELNCFFMGSAISKILGGFCSKLKSIYGIVDGFFGLVAEVGALIKGALDALSKIKNLADAAKAAFDKIKIKALIEMIKELIIKAIKMHLKCVLDAISNFIGVFDEMIEAGQRVKPAVGRKYSSLRQHVQETWSEENQETLLEKIEGTIDYAMNRMANPNVVQVEAMVARICGMSSQLEGLINDSKAPLDRFAEKVAASHANAKAASAPSTAEAIAAGRPVLSDETRTNEINNLVDRCAQAAAGAVDSTPEDAEMPPVNTTPIRPEEREGVPSWDDLWQKNDPRFELAWGFRPGRATSSKTWSGGMGSEGWNGMLPDTKIRLMRLQEALGKRLLIRSGYRNRLYNRVVAKSTSTESLHIHRRAIDLSYIDGGMSSFAEQQRVFRIARQLGFTGTLHYPDFIHIDTRSEAKTLNFR